MDILDRLHRVPCLDGPILPRLVSITIYYMLLYSRRLRRFRFPNFLRKIVCLFYLQRANRHRQALTHDLRSGQKVLSRL